ncbi:hypothetical protein A464_589 [Salmonella bongori N268-08]|uniref:Uncharacterized protein n=1 Tax=Salmonella bongori N268-08 TaxID=1197719 RepID=S5N5L8_SALBN|nr:hypothetical protein A464_589 [Salmonella bongori N268-08]
MQPPGITVNVAFVYKRVAITQEVPGKQAALGFFLEKRQAFFKGGLS